ncbi:MAG: dihydropteroate synthase [Hyphomicrobiaceae bacterium]|nr:dihydropteroate synthase [Hyphomicrobiaceae bacterium]
MTQRLLFLTGRLAEARLTATVASVGLPEGSWRVDNLGIKVAALMTEGIVRNRLKGPIDVDRVIVPGRTRMNLDNLASHFGVRFERGPDELVDLPVFLGRGGTPTDFTRHNLRIFAEIVEAPRLSLETILDRAARHRADGADVIDVGCEPEVPFAGLEQTVRTLKAAGHRVSVDSGEVSELRRAALAGADYVLSLDETTLGAVAGTQCVPILVPRPHGDLASLIRAIDKAKAAGIAHIADPILDPLNFGFTTSIERYAELRRQRPDVEILMGTGNLTELTEADSQGLTALLVGICSELEITNVLIVQVSPHTRRTVAEHDAARRLMYRAKEDGSLPKGYGGNGLLGLHDLNPHPLAAAEIAVGAAQVRDDNFRIEVSDEGIHVYSRQGHHVVTDPFAVFDKLGVEADGGHAFYLGYELAKAEMAWRLGKRYAQDNPLDWGVAAKRAAVDLTTPSAEGATLKAKREAMAHARAAKLTPPNKLTPSKTDILD